MAVRQVSATDRYYYYYVEDQTAYYYEISVKIVFTTEVHAFYMYYTRVIHIVLTISYIQQTSYVL